MAIDLTGRVCLVTGAKQGIGESVARGFAKRGAIVVATDLEPPSVQGAAANLAWDVTQARRAEEIVGEVVDRFGRLDVLVANAGIYPKHDWETMSEAQWRKILAVNLDGAWFGAQAAGRAMTKAGYGKIVLVSSVTVTTGRGEQAHYVTAKAGIIGLTRSLARGLGKSGVRVNCIMPGAVRTPTELEMYPDQEAVARFCAERQCLPHRIESDDIEPSFAFLASAESDAITGQVLCVDHGLVHW